MEKGVSGNTYRDRVFLALVHLFQLSTFLIVGLLETLLGSSLREAVFRG